MGKLGSGETAVEVGGDPLPPELRRPRRCVQSKLTWHVPKAEPAPKVEEEEEEKREPEESESESEGKRKRKRKSKPRASRKSPLTSKEAGVPSAGNKNSSVSASNRHCRQLKNKKKCESTPKKATPKKATPKKATPKKATPSHDSDPKDSDSHQKQADDQPDATKDLDDQMLKVDQPVIDLWLEAKIAAEENIRLYAGKPTHPFFNRKAAKKVSKVQDIMDVESHWLSLNEDYLVSCPIHVSDILGDDVVSLEWGNWEFAEGSPFDLNGSYIMEDTRSAFDGSVEPLKLDTASLVGMDLDQIPNRVKKSSCTSTKSSYPLSKGQDTKGQLFSHPEEAHVSNNDLSSRCASFVDFLENDQQKKLFEERLASYCGRNSYSPDCCLWTNKYQPGNASEVCGNRDSIRFLSEWLKSWHERGLENSERSRGSDQCDTEDDEGSLYENGSELEETDDSTTLKNVLLITGPIGSGKSAAIYACAKEQGFEVIEVNASDLRNGSLVKQKYGEAMESHGFNRWSAGDTIGPSKKNLFYLLSNPDIREGKKDEHGLLEMISSTCDQDTSPIKCSSTVLRDAIPSHQVASKSLILFEDVDTVFEEDRGFISTILQLAQTAKRPIILTSNNNSPVLPHVLDRLVLDFTFPSRAELLSHIYMICESEKAHVPPHLLEKLIKSCTGDMRKTLMHLQFWCQGKLDAERSMQFTYSPLSFDVDATHLVLPRVIPWEFQCELPKKVEEEIRKAIYAMEENMQSMNSMKLQELNTKEMIDFSIMEDVSDTIKTRKIRRLTKNQSFLNYSEVSPHANDLEDFSEGLDSPAICADRTVRHRATTVLSSDSEEDGLPPTNIFPDVSRAPISQMHEGPDDLEHSIYPVYQTIRADAAQDPFECSRVASASYICDTFKLQDISCVPESFMSVTESKNDGCPFMAVSSNNMSVSFSGFIKSIHVPPEAEPNDLDRANADSGKYVYENVVSACEVDSESVHGTEEQGECQDEDDPSGGLYHLMDECSRADFSMRMVLRGNSAQSLEADSVQEAWRKLRSHCRDLRPHLANNHREASLIMKLTSGLTDLVSETDIMFSTCYPLVNDILESSQMPCIEPDSFSWYEEQFEMGSTCAQHGLCFYRNRCASVGLNPGCDDTMNLALELLASSNKIMALGKLLIRQDDTYQNSYVERSLHLKGQRDSISMERELECELYNAVLSIVPARSSMALRGPAFHEYLSFMSQITKLECCRLSESIKKNQQRRSRPSRHYLCSGSLALSQEHIELLARSSCFNDAGS